MVIYMEIGQIIRKYRKAKNLTQEEMANRLGVTAPAVNKWENGNACPDIMLLTPIARLLDITLDELLSFRENLTEEEIRDFVKELDERLKDGSFEEAFQWAKTTMEQYPNCLELVLSLAVVLDAACITRKISDASTHEEFIEQCYVRALGNGEETIRTRAADVLFGFCFRKEEYEKAESYLSYFSKENPERKRKQAYIYSVTGRLPEAYKAYEEMLFTGYGILSLVFQNLYTLAFKENDMNRARRMVERQRRLAGLFEMGKYNEVYGGLELALVEKDKEAVLEIAKDIISGLEDIASYKNSELYAHLTFKEPQEDFIAGLRKNLFKTFRDEENFGFMKDDPCWKEFLNENAKSC